MLKPAIVVAAFNRRNSLERLLISLNNAQYDVNDIMLVISIDFSDQKDAYLIAKSFSWNYGEKKIIKHDVHLGLKKHLLQCGDLAIKYNSIILLEDDLIVSKYFYSYAYKTCNKFDDLQELAGISLYSYKVTEALCENGHYPFIPIEDGNNVYLMKVPSSWGIILSGKQWNRFRKWYSKNRDELVSLPKYVKDWPTTSWKKHYFSYMISEQQYFLYPKISYSTNFGQSGTSNRQEKIFQVPLSEMADLQILSSTFLRYNEYFEIEAQSLNKYVDEFKQYDYQVDLYACTDIKNIKKDYILTTRESANKIFSFGLDMVPLEMNVIYNNKGSGISFTRTKDTKKTHFRKHEMFYNISPIASYIFSDYFKKISSEVLKEKSQKIGEEIGDVLGNKISNSLFKKYVKNYDFQINFPKFSIITPIIKKCSRKHVENIINIVKMQNYPNYEHIFIDLTGFNFSHLKLSQNILYKFSDTVDNIASAVVYGMSVSSGNYIGILRINGKYYKNTLKNAAHIFGKFKDITWLTGIPSVNNGNNIILNNSNPFHNNPRYLFNKNFMKSQRLFYFENVFWSRWLWDQALGNKAEVEKQIEYLQEYHFWDAFFEKTKLYFVNLKLGSYKYSVKNKKMNHSDNDLQLNVKKIANKYQLGFFKMLISGLSSLFYRYNIPLMKYIYSDVNNLPPRIYYNEKAGSFFLNK